MPGTRKTRPSVCVQRQTRSAKRLKTTATPPQTPTSHVATASIPGPVMKPKDVPMLDLFQLSGLEAAGRLQIFFEAVEKCTTDDNTRVMIAKNKLSSELAMLIHNNQAKFRCTTWRSFVTF